MFRGEEMQMTERLRTLWRRLHLPIRMVLFLGVGILLAGLLRGYGVTTDIDGDGLYDA